MFSWFLRPSCLSFGSQLVFGPYLVSDLELFTLSIGQMAVVVFGSRVASSLDKDVSCLWPPGATEFPEVPDSQCGAEVKSHPYSYLFTELRVYLGNRGHFKLQEIKLRSTDLNLIHKLNPCPEVVSAHCSISVPDFRPSSFAYKRWRKISPLSFQHLNCHPVFLFPSLTGWQVLVEEEEEQRGGEAFTRRAAPKGEPDRRARRFPRAGKRGTAAGSARAQEELQPLQEDHGSVRGQVRPSVRTDLIKTHSRSSATNTSKYLYNIYTWVCELVQGGGDGGWRSRLLRHTRTDYYFFFFFRERFFASVYCK